MTINQNLSFKSMLVKQVQLSSFHQTHLKTSPHIRCSFLKPYNDPNAHKFLIIEKFEKQSFFQYKNYP